jgi:RNA polymerase-binding transcription factor DksA
MSGSHSDNLDRAAELQQIYNEAALERIRILTAPESDPDFDGVHCLDCDADIPGARLALGRIRCVLCQTAKEKLERMIAR